MEKLLLGNDYFILGLVDNINDISVVKFFKYWLEVNLLGIWGGIWEVFIEYM